MNDEQMIWTGSPSQTVNIPVFIFCLLLFWTVIPLFLIIWRWLAVANIKYELTTQRLILSDGVLTREINELELYRVKDMRIVQPFLLRIFHLGNIILATSDASHPVVIIQAIPEVMDVQNKIRNLVEQCREKKHVRELDVN